jgi:hypothetical protein
LQAFDPAAIVKAKLNKTQVTNTAFSSVGGITSMSFTHTLESPDPAVYPINTTGEPPLPPSRSFPSLSLYRPLQPAMQLDIFFS